MELRFRQRFAHLALDHIEHPPHAGGKSCDRAPELQLELLDIARGLELLLGPQHIELRHVAEVHRQEARGLILRLATLFGGGHRGFFDGLLLVFFFLFLGRIVRHIGSRDDERFVAFYGLILASSFHRLDLELLLRKRRQPLRKRIVRG